MSSVMEDNNKPKPAGLAGLKPAQRRRISPRVEIVRSFTYKLNLGNYQSADFFMSQKSECAIEDQEAVSEAVYRFCKSEVMKAVNEVRAHGGL